jgi:hypothetical protein
VAPAGQILAGKRQVQARSFVVSHLPDGLRVIDREIVMVKALTEFGPWRSGNFNFNRLRHVSKQVAPAVETCWIGLQSRLPTLLLTLSSFELTFAMVVGMCLGAIKRPDRLA